MEPQSNEPVENAHTPDKSTSTMNANQSNLSLPSCSLTPSFQPPSKSFAKTRSRRKMTADEESYFKKAVADLQQDENLPAKSIISALYNGNFYMSCPSATEFTKLQIRDKYKTLVRRENRIRK